MKGQGVPSRKAGNVSNHVPEGFALHASKSPGIAHLAPLQQRYFFKYFFKSLGPTSAPKTFPSLSTPTPSAVLDTDIGC